MIICQCHDESFPWHSGNQKHQGEDEVNNDALGEDESEGRVAVPNRMNFWKSPKAFGKGGGAVIFNAKIYIADFGPL